MTEQLRLIPLHQVKHSIRTIPLSEIEDAEWKPDQGLVRNLQVIGQIQPVVVIAVGNRYRLIAGRKRVAAAREGGMDTVVALVIEEQLTEAQVAAIILSENLLRKPNPGVEANAIRQLIQSGITEKGIARLLGISQAQVSQRLSLLKLVPEVAALLGQGRISSTTARELAKLPAERQRQLAEAGDLSMKAAQAAVRERKLRQVQKLPIPDTTMGPIDHALLLLETAVVGLNGSRREKVEQAQRLLREVKDAKAEGDREVTNG